MEKREKRTASRKQSEVGNSFAGNIDDNRKTGRGEKKEGLQVQKETKFSNCSRVAFGKYLRIVTEA